LLGSVAFRNLELTINKDVLIPRPETELLIDVVHEFFSHETSFTALDIGTGSGNIALSLLDEFPESEVTALDISKPALHVAEENAQRLKLRDRINFLKSNVLDSLNNSLRFDLIVSNPPYISLDQKEKLQKELDFEPSEALFSGTTGLECVEKILAQAKPYLKPEGLIIMELGLGQVEKAQRYACQHGYKKVMVKKDYSGINRILVLRG